MITSLLTEEDVSGLFLMPTLEFFSSGELFHNAYGLSVSVFKWPLFIICPELSSEEAPAIIGQEKLSDWLVSL